jgi:multidrug efflux system membrane fusion protein
VRQQVNARQFLLLATAALLAGCGHKAETGPSNLPAAKVQTLRVDLQQTPEIYEVVGTVRPKVSATVSSKVMTTIEEIPVKAGDTVTAGQLLAKLDDRELRAEFDRTKSDYDRLKTLLAQQAIAQSEFDTVNARYRVAQAALSYARVVAPFDGVVASKSCDAGDLAAPNKPLFVIEQTSAYRLEARVPERFAVAGAVGKSVHVIIDATGEKCVGTIGESEPSAEAVSRGFLVKIDLDCRQPLKSGMFGRAQLLTGERPALFVNKSVVHQRGQLTYLFVVADGHAQMRLIKPGKEYLDAVEILSGLQAGERVVTSGEVADGQPVSE